MHSLLELYAKNMTDSFLPNWEQWINSHTIFIPRETAAFCGDLSGLTMLDVGCGDMIADIALLSLGIKHITGIDVLVRNWDVKVRAAQLLRDAGRFVPEDYASRLSYLAYDGTTFPLVDNSFDFVFSWSAFEHISDVPRVLSEIRRVVRPAGRIFVQVYPWFPSYCGSHISDFIDEPFFHLTRSPEWVRSELERFLDAHPDRRKAVMDELWPEYCSLNRYSARRFLSDVLDAGFVIERLQMAINDQHVASVPPSLSLSDAVSAGSMVLLRPAKLSTREEVGLSSRLSRNEELDLLKNELDSARRDAQAARDELTRERSLRSGLERSVSWRVTKAGRALMRSIRKLG